MREAYQSDLKHLVEDLVHMASLVENAIRDSAVALSSGDLALAERVIAADITIDERQVDLDEKIVELLARQSPVATDLRLLVAALRMSSSLERMGDLAEHVALAARRRFPDLVVPEHHREALAKMAELAVQGTHDAGEVIRTRDLALAALVERRDDEMDALQTELYRAVTRDRELPTEQVMDLILLGRYYERMGDHAVSLVRRVGFLVTGDSIDARSPITDVPEV
ncbi:phosphate signaling complex protein PhoU [Brachybacterium hainanense]|uniref:Phosphate-specific transport system accessory protein PhoU n=1 Tax=Brachybacterium hainanense TaxID=1541174 RepID=A0ABV6RGE3_9MICO